MGCHELSWVVMSCHGLSCNSVVRITVLATQPFNGSIVRLLASPENISLRGVYVEKVCCTTEEAQQKKTLVYCCGILQKCILLWVVCS